MNCTWKNSQGSACLSKQSTNENDDISTELLKENFYAYDHTVKIMLVGNKGAGKTTFLQSLLGHLEKLSQNQSLMNQPITLLTNAKPTQALVFRKTPLRIKDKLINLEFWDTNEQMFNSPIIKSIIILI
jgi:septin family protein